MTTSASKTWNRILALEDDSDDMDLLRLLLRKAGVAESLHIYPEGRAVVSELTNVVKNSAKPPRPLLCFLDVKIAAGGGHDVLRWIRGQPVLDRLPVVMLSGSEHPRDIQQAAQAGAQCYLAKYPQPRLLQQVVQEARRFSLGTPAEECFCFPANLLLVRCRRLTPVSDKPSRPMMSPPALAPSPLQRG